MTRRKSPCTRSIDTLSTTIVIGAMSWLLAFGLTVSAAAQEPAAGSEEAAKALRAVVDANWQLHLASDPILATSEGIESAYGELPSLDLADMKRTHEALQRQLVEVDAIDRARLSEADRVTWDVLRWTIREQLGEFELRHYWFPFNSDSGFHIAATWIPDAQPVDSVSEVEAYIRRLGALPTLFEQQMTHLRAGIEAGWTQPRVILDGYEVTIASHIVDRPEDSLFYAPFESFSASIPAAEHDRLRAAGAAAVMAGPVAAFESFLEFFETVYRPAARDTVGISEVPGGREYYANRVRHFTTLDIDAEDVHAIGLREVARIRAEMEALIEGLRQAGEFEGSFADFLAFLRTDPRFYAKTPDELLQRAAWISKKMDGALPRFFGRLPRQPYGVEPVPDFLAPKYTGGRYVGAPIDSTRSGTYWVNTYALDKRPFYTQEALSLHEAVPGHHLQGALSQELDLPRFRQELYISAFGEGWGLYSEWLGLEAGFYTDPYSDFGRLTYEMWRACRLVVDTGMHAKGWSRQQALDYLASNTALSIHEVTTEIDRYIGWPGQALAYKIGELKIRELRAKAEAALGPSFDLRAFHDVILSQGSLPLPVLEGVVDRWIAGRAAEP